MIRLIDALTLATTKLRSHKVRTAITVAIAGPMFGLILAVVLVMQGVFDSVERFSSEGLNNRTLVTVSHYANEAYNAYEHKDDAAFIAEIEKAQADLVARKTAAAKKYNISYNAATEDPSPVTTDPKTKQKTINDFNMGSSIVQQLVVVHQKASKPFDIKTYLAPYSSTHVIGKLESVAPTNGQLVYMKDGKEQQEGAKKDTAPTPSLADMGGGTDPILRVMDAGVTRPFVVAKTFNPAAGEVPVVLPYAAAEGLLGYKPLNADMSRADKLARLGDVRRRVGEITASFCYRNTAGTQLLATALSQQVEIEKNKSNAEYIMPSVQYAVPDAATCGAVTIKKDTRTAEEKKQDDDRILYEKEIGTYIGDPVQQKIVVRAVGLAGDVNALNMSFSLDGMVNSMLNSWLGYGVWAIPSDLFAQLPTQYRPSVVFDPAPAAQVDYPKPEEYLVEFGDKQQARQLLEKTGILGGMPSGSEMVTPFGSGILLIDEVKRTFMNVLFWALVVVGAMAVVILLGMIGRTIADGRRESAVFRAIGAKRLDIAGIYGAYAVLLSVRVITFAAALGGVLAGAVELLWWRDATIGARLAYAASDTTKEFHLVSVFSWYVPVVVGVIFVAGMVAAIIPIARNARRNPITDMRDE